MYDIILNAPNIRSGGGLVLLKSIVKAFGDKGIKGLLITNETLIDILKVPHNFEVKYIQDTAYARLTNEIFIKKISHNAKKILFFGNLPPLFHLDCKTFLYLQNILIINNYSLKGYSFKQKVRLVIERLWFRVFSNNVDRFAVQTKSMRCRLSNLLDKKIELLPFSGFDYVPTLKETFPNVDFIYPSSGEPHKNHRLLIEAWVLLAKKGFFPELHLTLDENSFKGLVVWINNKVNRYNLNIKNIGYVQSHNDMLNRMQSAGCMIFPSKLESFGLPLVEADFLKTSIIAAELDYVRDVVNPIETFNPDSSFSICAAVLRFMNKDQGFCVLKPEEFIDKIMDK
jgi:glycosyltransferase involved in cell wall biosynthesis